MKEETIIKESKIDDYLEAVRVGERIDNKYSNGWMLNRNWFSERDLIFRYTENLNLKDENVYKMPTGVFINAGINPENQSEILAFELSTPYLKFNLDRRISIISKKNVLQELQRVLIQFQQLNYTYNDYDLSDVYDDIAIRIHHQTKLLPNLKEIKEETIRIAKIRFEESIKGRKIDIVSDVIHELGLGELVSNYVYTGGDYDGRALLLKAIRRQDSISNNAKIDDCINCMMDSKLYIDANTIKDQLTDTGLRQIKGCVLLRKQEIQDYNVSSFGVKSYKMWKRKFEPKIPDYLQDEILHTILEITD